MLLVLLVVLLLQESPGVAGSKSLPASLKWSWLNSVLTFNVEKTLETNGTTKLYSVRGINGDEKFTLKWTDEPSSNGSHLVSFEIDNLKDNDGENAPNATVTENRNSTCGFEGTEWRLYLNGSLDDYDAEIYLLCDNQIFLTIERVTVNDEFIVLEMLYLQGSYNTGL
eukprot:sb/3472364/